MSHVYSKIYSGSISVKEKPPKKIRYCIVDCALLEIYHVRVAQKLNNLVFVVLFIYYVLKVIKSFICMLLMSQMKLCMETFLVDIRSVVQVK